MAMELKQAMQMAAWIFLGVTIAYAHFQMRKLRKIVFNHLHHLTSRQSPVASRRGDLREKLLSLLTRWCS
jgi:hypothetical protein